MSVVLMSVGDASGDLVAADFVRALRDLRPGLRFLGMGGDAMSAAGVELVVHQREVAVGGFVELLPDLPRIFRAWRRMTSALRREHPDLAVLVDASGFNLPFARRVQRLGVPAFYYVAPQVWGWRRGRIARLARRVSRVAVILPFEKEVYAGHPVPVDFVGHPLVDQIAATRIGRDEARRRLGLDGGDGVVALLPGSRRGELRHQLPLQLEVAQLLGAREPGLRFVLPVAPSLEAEPVEARVGGTGLPIRVVRSRSREVLAAADVALVKPGTSTLEAALLGVPLVVAARAHPLTAALARRLVRVDSLTLPNLIAGAPIVPELLQEAATPDAVASAVTSLLAGPARDTQLTALEGVRRALGSGGAARRAAAVASELLP